jgi:hypothetical protein
MATEMVAREHFKEFFGEGNFFHGREHLKSSLGGKEIFSTATDSVAREHFEGNSSHGRDHFKS